MSKVESAKKTMSSLNPHVEVICYHEKIDSSNIVSIINDKNYDFIIDGTDNFSAKFLINDACVLQKKPFSHGGILGFQGQTMTYIPGKGPCYRCVFREPPPTDALSTGRQAGVLGVLPGVIGSLQATEALKYLLGIETLLNRRLLAYNSLTMEFRTVTINCGKDCQVCGDSPTITYL
jgi:molybdopterin/thiamine biosynthesis adenylyltransferase